MTQNYRIEIAVHCDLETLEKALDAIVVSVDDIVDCAEQVFDADTDEPVDI